ncbi:MAG: DUF6666 family protein [Pirellulales bacterium]
MSRSLQRFDYCAAALAGLMLLASQTLLAVELPLPSPTQTQAGNSSEIGTGLVSGTQGTEFASIAAQPAEETFQTEAYSEETWRDNFSIFTGINGAKQPQDLGINANLGGRLAFNSGFALSRDRGIGLQVGVAYDYSQNAVGVLKFIDGTRSREQLFTTVGVFQRHDSGINWALGYDILNQNYFDNFLLTQWRGRIGYQWNEYNEFGVWGAVRDRQDDGSILGFVPVHLRTINQANFFWRHTWETGPQTMMWAGLASSHSKNIFVLPIDEMTGVTPIIGASINVPLNDWLSIYGETNLILPGDSGTVDAFLGFTITPSGGAKAAPYRRFAPMLPTGGSPSMAVDLQGPGII